MSKFNQNKIRSGLRPIICVIALAALSACASESADVSRTGIDDPYEERNRKVHEFNRGLDRGLVKPASKIYGNVLTPDMQDSVGHFSKNLGMPGQVANNILQGDLGGATNNSVRFVFNVIFGLGGLFDPASDFGIPHDPTGFGETLHVWGAKEGAYVELPFFGPSTTRDTAGLAADILLDPLSLALPNPEKFVTTGAYVAARVGDRHKYTSTVDSILYESADSYTQAQTLYLQNRRFELSGGNVEDTEAYDDPYDDF